MPTQIGQRSHDQRRFVVLIYHQDSWKRIALSSFPRRLFQMRTCTFWDIRLCRCKNTANPSKMSPASAVRIHPQQIGQPQPPESQGEAAGWMNLWVSFLKAVDRARETIHTCSFFTPGVGQCNPNLFIPPTTWDFPAVIFLGWFTDTARLNLGTKAKWKTKIEEWKSLFNHQARIYKLGVSLLWETIGFFWFLQREK